MTFLDLWVATEGMVWVEFQECMLTHEVVETPSNCHERTYRDPSGSGRCGQTAGEVFCRNGNAILFEAPLKCLQPLEATLMSCQYVADLPHPTVWPESMPRSEPFVWPKDMPLKEVSDATALSPLEPK